MRSRLDAVGDWEGLARKAGYHAADLAALLDISPHQLRLYFLARFALSTKRWLEQLRLRDAQPLLRNGQCIKQIALRLGFRHATHFSRAFRHEFGIAPSDFLQAYYVPPGADVRKWSQKSDFGLKSPKMVAHSPRLLRAARG